MITAVQAKSVSDAVNNDDPVDPALINESNPTGNLIIDELNHSAVWAAKSGEYSAYLAISKYNDDIVNMALDNLVTLGYDVDTTRLGGYKEIAFSWE